VSNGEERSSPSGEHRSSNKIKRRSCSAHSNGDGGGSDGHTPENGELYHSPTGESRRKIAVRKTRSSRPKSSSHRDLEADTTDEDPIPTQIAFVATSLPENPSKPKSSSQLSRLPSASELPSSPLPSFSKELQVMSARTIKVDPDRDRTAERF
jgi:hypothetical protein